MSILHYLILTPFIFAFIIPLLAPIIKRKYVGWFTLLVPAALFSYFLTYINEIRQGGAVLQEFHWVPSLGIHFTARLDGLSMLFSLLITGVGILVVLYSIFYLDSKKEKLRHFYFYLLMFMGAMLGVVLSDNLIVLYVFWELTSLSSTLLISFWHERDKSVYGARKSMLITVFGGFAMMAGFILLYLETGTFSIQSIVAQVDTLVASPLFVPAMILVLLGAFTKSAQFPFHFWLPDAMEAPTPVSAYLHSATMVKAGIYLVARMTAVFGGSLVWFWVIVITGLITLCWGSVSAVRQKDLKGILAFSTISQLGLIMTLLGIGSLSRYGSGEYELLYSAAIIAAIVHIINHATFKGSLFMVVGIIDHETGTRDIRKLGGLMSIMPVTFTVSLIGLAAMAGIPPFNGFISKEMFFTAVLSVGEWHASSGFWLAFIAWAASIFTFLYCAIMLFKTFIRKPDPGQYEKPVHEAPTGLLFSPVVLGVLVVLLGLFPDLLVPTLVEPAVASVLHVAREEVSIHLSLWHGLNLELLMSLGVIVCGLLLFKYWPRLGEFAFFKRERDPFNFVYDKSLDGLTAGSGWITRLQMTGRLRDYLAFMLVFMIGLLGYTFVRSGSFAILTQPTEPASGYVYGLTLFLIIATFALLFMKERLSFIITLGVLGLIVSLLFTVFSAQDLALTQLLVETVTVILLLLAFRHLPKITAERMPVKYKTLNIAIAAAVGSGVFFMGMSAFMMRSETSLTPISEYFKQSYELAGGKNMVNVILVDFRGLDTFLEVTVLGIVALAIIMLIKHRFKGGEDV